MVFGYLGLDQDYIKQLEHTPGCELLGEGRLMAELDVLEQDAIWTCPHHSHDVVRTIFSVPFEGAPSKAIESGRLF